MHFQTTAEKTSEWELFIFREAKETTQIYIIINFVKFVCFLVFFFTLKIIRIFFDSLENDRISGSNMGQLNRNQI